MTRIFSQKYKDINYRPENYNNVDTEDITRPGTHLEKMYNKKHVWYMNYKIFHCRMQ
jgi:hypothetical protein